MNTSPLAIRLLWVVWLAGVTESIVFINAAKVSIDSEAHEHNATLYRPVERKGPKSDFAGNNNKSVQLDPSHAEFVQLEGHHISGKAESYKSRNSNSILSAKPHNKEPINHRTHLTKKTLIHKYGYRRYNSNKIPLNDKENMSFLGSDFEHKRKHVNNAVSDHDPKSISNTFRDDVEHKTPGTHHSSKIFSPVYINESLQFDEPDDKASILYFPGHSQTLHSPKIVSKIKTSSLTGPRKENKAAKISDRPKMADMHLDKQWIDERKHTETALEADSPEIDNRNVYYVSDSLSSSPNHPINDLKDEQRDSGYQQKKNNRQITRSNTKKQVAEKSRLDLEPQTADSSYVSEAEVLNTGSSSSSNTLSPTEPNVSSDLRALKVKTQNKFTNRDNSYNIHTELRDAHTSIVTEKDPQKKVENAHFESSLILIDSETRARNGNLLWSEERFFTKSHNLEKREIESNRRHRLLSRRDFPTSDPRTRPSSQRNSRPFPDRTFSRNGNSLYGSSSFGGQEPEPVSLRVVVHLQYNRDTYGRQLSSAISKGIRKREFLPLKRYIQPSGEMVQLRNEQPRNILRAFCEDILGGNTTTVFHLINPFFHSRSWSSAQYVSNLLSTLDMPVITWGPEYIGVTDKKESDTLQLTISPTLHHQAEAMLSVLRLYNWSDFGVVYTPSPGHDAFLTALRILINEHNSKTRMSGFNFRVLAEVEVANISNRLSTQNSLRELRLAEVQIILLYCFEGDTLAILDAATEMGLMDNNYQWFMTFEAINKNREQRANMFPIGLLGIHYDYREDEMQSALELAVDIWLRGLRDSIMNNLQPGMLPTGLPWTLPNLRCESNNTLKWHDGHMFYEILKNVSFDDVSFNELGHLKSKAVSIVNVQPPIPGEDNKHWKEVGRFGSTGVHMQHITWPGNSLSPPSGKPKRHFLRVVTREEAPFVEYRNLDANGSCGMFSSLCHVYERDKGERRISNGTVRRCCTGLSIDFLHRLATDLNFDFYLYEVEDFQWGVQIRETHCLR